MNSLLIICSAQSLEMWQDEEILFQFIVIVQVMSSTGGQGVVTVLTQHMVDIICSHYVTVNESQSKHPQC